MDDGSWINNRADIQDYFEGSFSSLYQFSNPQIPGELENLINSCISDEENVELCRIPSRDEIKKVDFGMKSLKAPGPNGFPPPFYKHYWAVGIKWCLLCKVFFFFSKWLDAKKLQSNIHISHSKREMGLAISTNSDPLVSAMCATKL